MTTENNEQGNEQGNENAEANKQTKIKEQQADENLVNEVAAKQAQVRQALAEGKTEFENVNIDADVNINEPGNGNQEEQGEEIDDKLVEAARSVGMTDEQIIDMATDNPQALETLAGIVNKSENSNAPESKNDKTGDETENKSDGKNGETDETIDLDSLDPEVVKVVKPLLKQIKALEEKVTKSNQAEETRQAEEVQAAINRDFDSMTEAYPVLGNTESMTEVQFRLRESVLEEALAISNLPSAKKNNIEWADCLKQAATSLLGNPKPGNKNSKLKNQSAKDIKKLYTQKPSGRKKGDKSTKNADGTQSEAELADNIAAIQASVRTSRSGQR